MRWSFLGFGSHLLSEFQKVKGLYNKTDLSIHWNWHAISVQSDAGRIVRPYPRHLCSTSWAGPGGGQTIFEDDVAHAFYYQLIAMRTEGMLIFSHLTGEVACIYITETSFTSDLGSAQENARVRVIGIRHLVVLMKSSDMPGDIGRDARQEARCFP